MTRSRLTGKRWKTRLADARRRNRFTKDDKLRSNSWGTCAVGEAPLSLTKVRLQGRAAWSGWPGTWRGPKDMTLMDLGLNFMTAVHTDRVPDAIRIYTSIQARLTKMRDSKRRPA